MTSLFITVMICISAFEVEGDFSSWRKTDFIGFDEVGDCLVETGDITSVFSKMENDRFHLRITFDDMIKREYNEIVRDNFLNSDLTISIQYLNLENFKLSNLEYKNDYIQYLRTPSKNLVEFAFKIDEIPSNFKIDIVKNNEIADSFNSAEQRNLRGGNCAFVHHGNQGLTYTEVFYGQYPQETSGFDEVLEAHQATETPGNFHMSGTLIPAAEWHNPEFNDWLVSGTEDGYVSMMTSALGQQIMPFLHNDMNDWSVSVENEMVEYRYDYVPKIAWVPERVWLTPNVYPEAGVIDWLGDNWEQHGVEAVILDDSPHCDGHSNYKIHWMNNGSGITLRVIPINNQFVGNMHYDADAAKNQISGTGQYGIAVYGTDWEVAAEMNQHNGGWFLDNYEDVLWYCHDNYPAVNVWKLDDAIYNTDFNGDGIEITNGTYYLLGGYEGYGYGNNGWYIDWASAESHSDYHEPAWNYGFIWNDIYENLMDCPDNSLAQLGWYTLMINLHETGWHDEGQISGWEHRYSAHMKNANVYAEASRWANGNFTQTTAAYEDDIDRDGINELIIYNDKTFFVFEQIGGKANWIFAKDDSGNMYSVVGSDVAYWSETEGDYNESSNNHVAALSDVSPNFQHDNYDFEIVQSSGDEVEINLIKDNLQKNCKLQLGNSYLEVQYNTDGNEIYVKSGWTPDLMDIIWNGKNNLQRMWGENGEYCGRRNSSTGATAAFVMGNAGSVHNGTFEGTLVMGDEIHGTNFPVFLYAGYTSEPYDPNFNKVIELDDLASLLDDDLPPSIVGDMALIVADNKAQIVFSEPVTLSSAQNVNNYELPSQTGYYSIISADLTHERKVTITIAETFNTSVMFAGNVSNIEDLNGNVMPQTYFDLTIPLMPHLVGTFNNWDPANLDYELELQDNGIWKTIINLPAGTHAYKVNEWDDWAGQDWPSSDQVIILSETTDVEFYANCGLQLMYKNNDEYVFHSPNPPVVCSDFLSEIGGIDWNEETTLTQMNDDGVDGDQTANDGKYTFQAEIPAGNYEYKIVLNNNWDQNPTTANLHLNLSGNSLVRFQYDMVQNGIGIVTTVDIDDNEIENPSHQNVILSIYPNPFNPQTNIEYQLAQTEKVELKIYNIKGQLVETLIDEEKSAGRHSIIWNSNHKASGVYFLKIQTEKNNETRKMVLLK